MLTFRLTIRMDSTVYPFGYGPDVGDEGSSTSDLPGAPAGSIEGDVKRKTLLPGPEGEVSLAIQPLSPGFGM